MSSDLSVRSFTKVLSTLRSIALKCRMSCNAFSQPLNIWRQLYTRNAITLRDASLCAVHASAWACSTRTNWACASPPSAQA